MNREIPKGWTLIANGDDGYAAQKGSLRVIVSWGGDWDHVSVSCAHRCPTWDEMCTVKDAFFSPEECVIQYHPPHSKYVNCHPHCLHLWRPQKQRIPTPPLEYV